MEVDLDIDHIAGLEIERNELALVVLGEAGRVEVHDLLDDGNGTRLVDTDRGVGGTGLDSRNRHNSARRIRVNIVDGNLGEVEVDTRVTTEGTEASRELVADCRAEGRVVLDGGEGAGVTEDGVGEVGENEVLERVELRVRG